MQDCNDVWGGTAEFDQCGECGGETYFTNSDGELCEPESSPDCLADGGINSNGELCEPGSEECLATSEICACDEDGSEISGTVLDECGECGGDGIADGACE